MYQKRAFLFKIWLLNLNENIVRRLMAHAATYHVFFQSERDYFVHTASSRLLAENEGMRNWILMGVGETMPATYRVWVHYLIKDGARTNLSFLDS